MKKLLFVLIIILRFPDLVYGQVDCNNIGFELGNTNGWVGTHGTVTDQGQQTVYGTEIQGTLNTLHYVTSLANGNDPKISAIPMVAPGSTHSIRLGNTEAGGDFSRIRTDYLITTDNTLFQFKFAVLLQNTSGNEGQGRAFHEPYQKPGFNIQIFDSKGAVLPCSNYDIQLQGKDAVDGFLASGDIQYRNWTTGAIDLRNYVGKTITIQVTAHGCTRQRHFGYAYFDAQCLKSEIKPMSSCPDADGFMTLMAPDGFGKYTWNNGATTQNIKVKANLGDKYFVKMIPLSSLDESCALQLDYAIQFKETFAKIEKTICEGDGVAVGDTLYKTSGTFVRKVSLTNVCDSTVTLILKVNPVGKYEQTIALCKGDSLAVGDTTYRTAGTFIRNVVRSTGCDSVVTTHLSIVELDLRVPASAFMTQGDSVQVIALVQPPGQYKYRWESPADLSCPACDVTWAAPDKSTRYTVFATDPDEVCQKSGIVQIFVKPCGISVPDAFSPNQDNNNEVFFVYGSKCVKQVLKMVIYNRWGEVIFQRENFPASDPASGWDGRYNGLISESGVYPYKIKVELLSGKLTDYKGAVNLIR